MTPKGARTERNYLKLLVAVAATPDEEEQATEMAALCRDVYEAVHGAGSYPDLVKRMLNHLDNFTAISAALLEQWRKGQGDAVDHGIMNADAATMDRYAEFVVYTQATRAELEDAAGRIGIRDLGAVLREHWPADEDIVPKITPALL